MGSLIAWWFVTQWHCYCLWTSFCNTNTALQHSGFTFGALHHITQVLNGWMKQWFVSWVNHGDWRGVGDRAVQPTDKRKVCSGMFFLWWCGVVGIYFKRTGLAATRVRAGTPFSPLPSPRPQSPDNSMEALTHKEAIYLRSDAMLLAQNLPSLMAECACWGTSKYTTTALQASPIASTMILTAIICTLGVYLLVFAFAVHSMKYVFQPTVK